MDTILEVGTMFWWDPSPRSTNPHPYFIATRSWYPKTRVLLNFTEAKGGAAALSVTTSECPPLTKLSEVNFGDAILAKEEKIISILTSGAARVIDHVMSETLILRIVEAGKTHPAIPADCKALLKIPGPYLKA